MPATARRLAVTVLEPGGRAVRVAANPIRFEGEDRPPQHLPAPACSDTERLLAGAALPVAAPALPAAGPDRAAVAALAGVPGPLAGTLVLELCGDEPSGTFGTLILADHGATVVKIERPPATDPEVTVFAPDGRVPADIAYFFGLNRNKLSLALDLKRPEGRRLMLDLVRVADVVYDNYRPGVTQRLGLDAPALRAVRPDILCASVSGFGRTGPWSGLPAYDATIQALGGRMSLTGSGEPHSPPVRWGNPIGGIGGALYAVVGILAALHRRARGGIGAALDIALLDAQLANHAYRVPTALSGREYGVRRAAAGRARCPMARFWPATGHGSCLA